MADYSMIKDQNGAVLGLWLKDRETAQNRDLLTFLLMKHDLPLDLVYHIQSGNYRIVANTFDNAGGCFAMFGSNPAPGEKVRPQIKTTPPTLPISVKTAPKSDAEGQGFKPQAGSSKSTVSVDLEMLPCPVCSSTSRKRIRNVWWGGGIGAKLLHLQRCLECQTAYHGKTGKRLNYLNSRGMGWSILVTSVFGLSLAGAPNDAGFILIPFVILIFPLMVVPYIYHRGRSKWALAVFISTWFAIGLPVALAAIWASRKRPFENGIGAKVALLDGIPHNPQ